MAAGGVDATAYIDGVQVALLELESDYVAVITYLPEYLRRFGGDREYHKNAPRTPTPIPCRATPLHR